LCFDFFRSFPRILDFLSFSFEQIELQAKLLNYFLGSNKSNINQFTFSIAAFTLGLLAFTSTLLSASLAR